MDADSLRHKTLTPFVLVLSLANALYTSKTRICDLAVFGGDPEFARQLHVGGPNIGQRRRFEERLNDILDSRWLTNSGRYVREFEERVAEITGVKYCIATCNGTVALELAIKALELTGEVIVPSFSFVAPVHALQWLGVTPIFSDINPQTHTLDLSQVEELISQRTTGILAVNLWGTPCDIDNLSIIARRYALRLLFDSAHAFGCSFKGRMIGGFGDAEVFSFHATKFLNSIEGGAVVTNNGDLAKRISKMRNFGFTDYDKTDCLGINGKMSEVSAAMGITNLESMDEFIEVNRQHYYQYLQELSGINGLTLLEYDESESCNYQYIVVEINHTESPITRDLMVTILHAENVLARRYFYPGCHRMEPYSSLYPNPATSLPNTDVVASRVLLLPTGTDVSAKEISRICAIVRLVTENAPDITSRLSEGPQNKRTGTRDNVHRRFSGVDSEPKQFTVKVQPKC